jgi:hypothetical protein
VAVLEDLVPEEQGDLVEVEMVRILQPQLLELLILVEAAAVVVPHHQVMVVLADLVSSSLLTPRHKYLKNS